MAVIDNEKMVMFKKGQSGNPAGRKKGTIVTSTVIKKWMAAKEKIINPLTGYEEHLTQLDIIILGQLAKARKGDTYAFNALMDRLEGRPRQKIESTISSVIRARIVDITDIQTIPPDATEKEDDDGTTVQEGPPRD